MRPTELLNGSEPMRAAVAARPRRESILLARPGFALITCTFALLAWALPTFGHDTSDIQSGEAIHVSVEEVKRITGYDDVQDAHWHLYASGPYEGQISGTPNCIAESYDPETDEFSRWNEETYSWDLSGCAGESSSSSQSEGGTSQSSGSSQSEGGTSQSSGSSQSEGGTSQSSGSSQSEGGTSQSSGSSQSEGGTSQSSGSSQSEGGTSQSSGSSQSEGGTSSTNAGQSSDATLRSLTLTGYYGLTPFGSTSISIGTFNPATTSYSASVDSDMLFILINPVNNHAGASSIPAGNLIVFLSDGSNVISIVVTAEDGSTSQTYTVTVTRGAGKRLASQPDQPQLYQNAPNPFNSQTVISYFLQQPSLARLEIFALNGQRVAVLSEGQQQAGHYRFHWNGRDDAGRALASGIYIYRLMTAEGTLTRKLTLLQ